MVVQGGDRFSVENPIFCASEDNGDANPKAVDFMIEIEQEETDVSNEKDEYEDEKEMRKSVNDDAQNIFSFKFLGLYTQYLAIGFLLNVEVMTQQFCFYYYEGDPNVCSTSTSVMGFANCLKIFIAFAVDTIDLAGYGWKGWMVFGWISAFAGLLILSIMADTINANSAVMFVAFINLSIAIATVPCDALSVHYGRLESVENRGKVIVSCMLAKNLGSVIGNICQALMLNGQQTNRADCPIGPLDCWEWGLNVNQYYLMMLLVVAIFIWPVYWLEVPKRGKYKPTTMASFGEDCFRVAKNAAFSLLILYNCLFNVGFLSSVPHTYVQYYLLQFSNIDNGLYNFFLFSGIFLGVYIFKVYLMKVNWRYAVYGACGIYMCIQSLWIIAYYNVGGMLNIWYVMFLGWDFALVTGIIGTINSLVTIEIAIKGLEATTFEIIQTIVASTQFAVAIMSNQFVYPFSAELCSSTDGTNAGKHSSCVDVTNIDTYNATDGPLRWTQLSLVVIAVDIVCVLISTPFLPGSIEECKKLKRWSEQLTTGNKRRVIATFVVTILLVFYVIISSGMLMDTSTSCQTFVGGTGC